MLSLGASVPAATQNESPWGVPGSGAGRPGRPGRQRGFGTPHRGFPCQPTSPGRPRRLCSRQNSAPVPISAAGFDPRCPWKQETWSPAGWVVSRSGGQFPPTPGSSPCPRPGTPDLGPFLTSCPLLTLCNRGRWFLPLLERGEAFLLSLGEMWPGGSIGAGNQCSVCHLLREQRPHGGGGALSPSFEEGHTGLSQCPGSPAPPVPATP